MSTKLAEIANTSLIAELRSAVGETACLTGTDIPARNLCDWSGVAPQTPLALVRPDTVEGVSAAMRICARHGVAAVPQGGMTGLCGGAVASPACVAISLERLAGIEEIDTAAATITVKAGTILQTIQEAVSDAGFFLALDLGARGSCTIGGNLSTNAGGNRVIRYGMSREMVLGIEAVLPDGTLVTNLNKMIKNNAGYDVKQLFIGSEGTLGIITRAVLRMLPKPRSVSAALCAVSGFQGVVDLLNGARQGLGPLMSAFEVMWPDYWSTVMDRVGGFTDPLPGNHATYVLVEAQGTDDKLDGERFQAWLEQQAESGCIADAVVSRSLADVKSFWAIRDACSEFPRVFGPHKPFDVGLPIAEADNFARTCREELEGRVPGAFAVFYGHIGDSNLHIVACAPKHAEFPGHLIEEAVYTAVKAYGGTISAEHGIGTVKMPWLSYTRSEAEIALMRQVKQGLDPAGLLNPGKVISGGSNAS
jgi:FAD/FMN-containing dehydrogenase